MKLLAFIFSFYIASLATVPAVATVYDHLNTAGCCSSASNCCSMKDDLPVEEKRNPMNCCTNGICNPFAACTCCFFFDQSPLYDFTHLPESFIRFANEQTGKATSCCTDCFRPPEMV